jgi:hypothetical protein
MKTLIKVTIALSAVYMLTGCSSGSGSDNNAAATNPYLYQNGYNAGSCSQEAIPTGSCPTGQNQGWSNELRGCFSILGCQGAQNEPGAIPTCVYGYVPAGTIPGTTVASCWPVHPF